MSNDSKKPTRVKLVQFKVTKYDAREAITFPKMWTFPENLLFFCGRYFDILDVAIFEYTNEKINVFITEDGHKLFMSDGYTRYIPVTDTSSACRDNEYIMSHGCCDLFLLPQKGYGAGYPCMMYRKETIYAAGKDIPYPDINELIRDCPELKDDCYDPEKQQRDNYPFVFNAKEFTDY